MAARPGGGLGALAERLVDERRALAELSPGGSGVAEVFESALVRLRGTPQGPAAVREFRRLSRLAGPAPTGGGPVLAGEFTGPAAAESLRLPVERAEELLDLLVEYGLLRCAAGGRYALHPLAALFGRAARWTADGIRMSTGTLPVRRDRT